MAKTVYGSVWSRDDRAVQLEYERERDLEYSNQARRFAAAIKSSGLNCPYVNYEEFIKDHPDYEVNARATCPKPFPNLKKALLWVVNPIFMLKRAKFWRDNALVEISSSRYTIWHHGRQHYDWFIVPQAEIDRRGSRAVRQEIETKYFEPVMEIVYDQFKLSEAQIDKILGTSWENELKLFPSGIDRPLPTLLEIEEELNSLTNRKER